MRRLRAFLSEWLRLLVKGDSIIASIVRWAAYVVILGVALTIVTERVELFFGTPTHYVDWEWPLGVFVLAAGFLIYALIAAGGAWVRDRKSTRLKSSHQLISYAVFCL